VSRDDSEQGAGAAQVQEGAALERQERGAVWGHQPHHTHGQRSQPAGPRMQPARTISAAPWDQPTVSSFAHYDRAAVVFPPDQPALPETNLQVSKFSHIV